MAYDERGTVEILASDGLQSICLYRYRTIDMRLSVALAITCAPSVPLVPQAPRWERKSDRKNRDLCRGIVHLTSDVA